MAWVNYALSVRLALKDPVYEGELCDQLREDLNQIIFKVLFFFIVPEAIQKLRTRFEKVLENLDEHVSGVTEEQLRELRQKESELDAALKEKTAQWKEGWEDFTSLGEYISRRSKEVTRQSEYQLRQKKAEKSPNRLEAKLRSKRAGDTIELLRGKIEDLKEKANPLDDLKAEIERLTVELEQVRKHIQFFQEKTGISNTTDQEQSPSVPETKEENMANPTVSTAPAQVKGPLPGPRRFKDKTREEVKGTEEKKSPMDRDLDAVREAIELSKERGSKLRVLTSNKTASMFTKYTEQWKELLRALGFSGELEAVGYSELATKREIPILIPKGMFTHHDQWEKEGLDFYVIETKPLLLLNHHRASKKA